MKHLTKTLAVVSLLVPMSAQPLGIGDLKLHSALNQKLEAEIHLNLAAGENPRDVTVKLASPEKFDQAGVPWSYFLSKIRFKPVVQANGSIVVKVTSREPLTEPFLDFLLEVTWPQGSQFREFTALIDPPAAYQTPANPSAGSFDYRVEPFQEYTQPARKTGTGRKRAAHRGIASQITPQTPVSGEYGPVKNAETLWSIAESLGGEHNVPTQDMMYALYNANPGAFNHGDMDSLKLGAVLRIPERDAILQGVAKAAHPSTGTEGSGKSLELVAPTETKTGEKAETAGLGQPGREGGAGAAKGSASGEGKDLELQARIDRLEQQLNMMQQLLALKDQQLAALQSNDQQAAEKAAETAQNLSPQPTQQPEATVAEPTAAPVPQEGMVAPTEVPATIVPAPAPTEVPKPIVKAPVQPPPAVEEESGFFSSSAYFLTLGGLGVGMLGVLGWLLWRKRQIESQTNTESMFASASQIRMPDPDSALAVPVLDINNAGAYDVGTVGESSFISDFTPSDFEAFDTDQTDIDPMSEADVYLAYGRYQQAEDLIRNAIEDHPEKDDYKLKLLEIFYANENKEGFEAYTQELVSIGKNNNIPFWSKVTDMGKEIIPESALFGGTGDVSTSSAKGTGADGVIDKSPQQGPASFVMDDDLEGVGSNDDDLSDLEATTLPDMELMDEVNSELAEMELTLSDEVDDNSLDFDLGTIGQVDRASSDAGKDEAAENLADIESIDFDFSDIGTESESKADQAKSEAAEPLESFDFSFDVDDKADGKSDTGASSDDEPLDMKTLESFEFPEIADADLDDGQSRKPPASSDGQNKAAGDEFDFNFDFEVPGSEAKSTDDDVDFGVSDLTDMDEFETKIDLAKAYIDMGDADAARVIAEEVLAKGNAEQKKSAQALLDELK